jgi:tetratricopeptide (TPR) repeat protein
MAILRRRLIREKKTPGVSHAAAGVNSEISAQTPTDSGSTAAGPAAEPVQTVNSGLKRKGGLTPFWSVYRKILIQAFNHKLPLLQYVLIAIVILSAVLLTYSLISSRYSSKIPAMVSVVQPAAVAETNQSLVSRQDIVASEIEPAEVAAAQTEPLSLQLAEIYYTSKDYAAAYNVYKQLRQNLVSPDFELVRDFLQFRMALCLEKKGFFDRANEQFRAVAESRSVALKALANYRCALLDMKAGQYLKARTRVYKTIALTGALAANCEWALDLERDCTFLAAEAVTRQVLMLCDADKELPQQLWSRPVEEDSMTWLNEAELRKLLNTGIEQLNSGLLAPQIRIVESAAGSMGLTRWSVVCNGPGIDELMARFSANAALDVRWVRRADGDVGTTARWNWPVTLYLPAATAQQVAATAAGAVGLLARIDDANTIIITNPAEYSSLSEHTRELTEHAIWLWRKLLLMYSDDQRNPNVHFALSVLQSQKGQLAEAIAEYKLVANRYSQTALAPFALLGSSRLKTTLRDYAGASRDLKQLIEQYPDNELIGQAHLNLAETTMKAGLYDEACSLYRKAYNLGFSTESRTIAAFGAGRCFYELKDYESAVKWLTRYIDATAAQQNTPQTDANQQSQPGADLYTAYLLLGKANLALGNLPQACDALNRTLRRATASDEYVVAVAALVETQVRQENFVAALGIIENVRAWPFSQEQVTRLLLLKSSVLRAMNLTDQAVTLLTDRIQYLTHPQLKAEIMLELARCHVTAKNLEQARAYLTEILSMVEPGPLVQNASLELAEVCLKLQDYQQTISICTRLLDSSAPEQTKQQASKILASAYDKQQEYDKAIVLLTATTK